MKKTHIVCYSGGISSAVVAIEVARRFKNEHVILLNHDISPRVEHKDIKRFKKEVADYLGLNITYANMKGWKTKDPLDVCIEAGAFKVGTGTALCTNRLKTKPFYDWLKKNYPVKKGEIREDVIIYYGFDRKETTRITRRVGIMAAMGYKTDYPLASWKLKDRTIRNLSEIGIKPPITYEIFRHANCIGCLKAGKQQWYVVYCIDYEYFKKAIHAEKIIGYSILRDTYLEDLECKFKAMKDMGIEPTETVGFQKFWAEVRKAFDESDVLPCECSF